MLPPLGLHISADTYGSDYDTLNNLPLLSELMDIAVKGGNLHIIGRDKKISHKFEPCGLTIVYPIEESHLSVHTWPEYGHAMIDLLSCGKDSNPHAAMNVILKRLRPSSGIVEVRYRGIFDQEKIPFGEYMPPKEHPRSQTFSLGEYLEFSDRMIK